MPQRGSLTLRNVDLKKIALKGKRKLNLRDMMERKKRFLYIFVKDLKKKEDKKKIRF